MIVSFSVDENHSITNFTIEVPSGIQTTTHQIAICDRVLYVQETGIQRVRAFDLDEDGHVIVDRSRRAVDAGIDEPFTCSARFKWYLNNSSNRDLEDMPIGWYSDDRYRHINALIPSSDGSQMFMLSPWIEKLENKNFANSNHIPGKNFFIHTWSNGSLVNITDKLGTPRAPASIITYSMPGFVKSHEVSTPYTSFCHDLVIDPINSNVVMMVTSDCEIVRIDTTTGCNIGSNISFSNAGQRWKRGLTFDGNKYAVGCAKTIQVLSSDGELLALHNVPAFPCCLVQTR
jgi:hypothetical protein